MSSVGPKEPQPSPRSCPLKLNPSPQIGNLRRHEPDLTPPQNMKRRGTRTGVTPEHHESTRITTNHHIPRGSWGVPEPGQYGILSVAGGGMFSELADPEPSPDGDFSSTCSSQGVSSKDSSATAAWATACGALSSAQVENEMGGKTGTTQNQSDGWFIGITPNLVTGVWTGCDDRSVHFRDIQYGQGAVSYTHLTLPTKRIV